LTNLSSKSVSTDGHLRIGGCDTVELAQTFGTPLYVYDEQLLRDTIRTFHDAFLQHQVKYSIAYAAKAFCTVAMCQLVIAEGCSLDVVSGGELYTALQAGVPAKQIHLHGNNKTVEELTYALDSGIGAVIVDNFSEMTLLASLAAMRKQPVDVLLRIAPGVTAHTHEYISTGQQDSKFGFDHESGQASQALKQVQSHEYLRCIGVHAHIGSQIFDTQGFRQAIHRLAQLYHDGVVLGLPFSVLNCGGGFGIRYTEVDSPEPIHTLIAGIITAVHEACAQWEMEVPEIWIEPGRSIVGGAGTTLYTVGSQKTIPNVRNYVAVDGGMTDNPRLALYSAAYEGVLANRMNDASLEAWSVAGKCCESGDMLIWDAPLPTPQAGDVLAVFSTGAYNYSMASHYNRIPNPAVVFVKDGHARIVVERESWADLVRHDRGL